MAKRARAKTSPTDWVKLIDPDAIDAAWDEAVVDAYDDGFPIAASSAPRREVLLGKEHLMLCQPNELGFNE